jgi:hypothetical protein
MCNQPSLQRSTAVVKGSGSSTRADFNIEEKTKLTLCIVECCNTTRTKHSTAHSEQNAQNVKQKGKVVVPLHLVAQSVPSSATGAEL